MYILRDLYTKGYKNTFLTELNASECITLNVGMELPM